MFHPRQDARLHFGGAARDQEDDQMTTQTQSAGCNSTNTHGNRTDMNSQKLSVLYEPLRMGACMYFTDTGQPWVNLSAGLFCVHPIRTELRRLFKTLTPEGRRMLN